MSQLGPNQPPSSPEPDPRETEFRAILDTVIANFKRAQELDYDPSSRYRHVTIDREVGTLVPQAKYAMSRNFEAALRLNRGPLIEITIPVDIPDARSALCLLTLQDPNASFFVRNTRVEPPQLLEINSHNFEQLYETVPGSEGDRYSASYIEVMMAGEIVPLRFADAA